ncbi:MAG: hypothetical protein JWM47_2124 [Acidimicrobiales bacterium]|nr:hypothetical protein [Acidimicrobiales bacterium]
MPPPSARVPRSNRLVVAGVSLLAVAGGLLAACGGDGDTSSAPQPKTAAGQRGMALRKDKGCQSCHSVDGKRMTGPTWKGLAGSEVELSGGRTVTADDAHLARAITDPRAEVVDGFANIMPENDLTKAEVADVIAYIHELSAG